MCWREWMPFKKAVAELGSGCAVASAAGRQKRASSVAIPFSSVPYRAKQA